MVQASTVCAVVVGGVGLYSGLEVAKDTARACLAVASAWSQLSGAEVESAEHVAPDKLAPEPKPEPKVSVETVLNTTVGGLEAE